MKVHFISIGGSVMHQLAIALHHKGYRVTGTDDEIFEPARSNLQAVGLLPDRVGWNIDMITSDLDAVILGMHAKSDNPELEKAKSLGLNIYSFPEYIYRESIAKKRVVVGGSHGKTTTTSMIMHVLQQAGQDFDYLVGAQLAGFTQSVKITEAPVIICEGDEYPASAIEKRPKFHFLFPQVAILTGIAWDHINVFPTFPFYLEQFALFIQKIEKGGLLIYNASDPVLQQLVAENIRADIRYQPYSLPQNAIAKGITTVTIDDYKGTIQVFGNHNLLNLQAAHFACKELGISTPVFLAAMKSFSGAAKRLEVIASNDSVIVFRDFAHAPSKVKATIDALKQQYPERKLIGILELHTYSSLSEAFMPQYNGALEKADTAIVFFAAHALALKRLPNLPLSSVINGFNKEGLVVINDKETLWHWLNNHEYNQTNIVLMSSGNYDGLDMLTFAKQITQ